jgi:putative DNA primase/helicase
VTVSAATLMDHIATISPTQEWPDPTPLPPDLPPVQAFDGQLLPLAMRAWVFDISERMQCPPDYVAVAAMVAAGSVIGRKVAIRPQAKTDWQEVANVWGCIVGRPGVMKSPALSAALKPINRLEVEAQKANRQAMAEHEKLVEIYAAKKKGLLALVTRNSKSNKFDDEAPFGDLEEPTAPLLRRYVLNDATYEMTGVVASHNPAGFLMFRDELVSFLKPLDRDENAAARGFFLTSWNGTNSYTFDRIGRGTIYIEACCMSVLGSTQPGKLASYLRHAVKGGSGDDGMAQRFQLLVWPDVSASWDNIDRYPDGDSARAVHLLFQQLDNLDAVHVCAEVDEFDPLPFLRFDVEALLEFVKWRSQHEMRVRSGDLHPSLEAHLAKYRGLVPKLALILHLVDRGIGAVGIKPLLMALAWVEYLESHAIRAYASVTAAETGAARTILAKLKSGQLTSPFTARDVHQHGWSGLTDVEAVEAAVALLVDHDQVRAEIVVTGGRPKTIYTSKPRGER